MASGPVGFKRLARSAEEVFSLEEQVGETPSGRAHRAFDRATRKGVVVWLAKGACATPDEVVRFRSRVERIGHLQEVVAPLYFGVDVANVPFVVLPAYDGRPLNYPTNDPLEVDRRISGCFAVVEKIHATGEGCGDLCLDSFIIRRDGSIALFCPLGEIRRQPETVVRSGEGVVQIGDGAERHDQKDIFFRDAHSLHAIAVALSGSKVLRAPQRAQSKHDASRDDTDLSTTLDLKSDNERGKDAVSNKRMDFEDPGSKYRGLRGGTEPQGAGSLGRSIAEQASGWEEPSVAARGSQSTAYQGNEDEREKRGRPIASHLSTSPRPLFHLSRPVAVLGGMVVVVIVSLFSRLVGMRSTLTEAPSSPYDESYYALSDKLNRLERQGETQSYSAALGQLGSARNEVEQKLVMAFLARVVRSSGLLRGGDLLIETSPSVSDAQSLLRLRRGLSLALAPGLTASQRFEEAARIFDIDPVAATSLAVALAFDLGDVDLARDFVVRSIKDHLPGVDADRYPTVGLIILVPQILNRFYEDIPAHRSSLTRTTLQSLLGELNRSGAIGVSLVAQLMSLGSLGQSWLDLIVNELGSGDTMPPSVRRSLIHGVSGECTLSDITTLGDWFSADSLELLGAILVGAKDPLVQRAIVERLADPSSGNPYVQRIASFCLSHYRDQAQRFFPLIGALAMPAPWRERTLGEVSPELSGVPKVKALMRTLIKGAPADVIKSLFPRYGADIEPIDLFDLLLSPDKGVRLLAVAALRDVNDILLLKLIAQRYEEEDDLEVRAAYERNISMIRDRLTSR